MNDFEFMTMVVGDAVILLTVLVVTIFWKSIRNYFDKEL